MATDSDLQTLRLCLGGAVSALGRLEASLAVGPSASAGIVLSGSKPITATTSLLLPWARLMDELLSEPQTVPRLSSVLGVPYWSVMFWLRVCVTYGIYGSTGRGFYRRLTEPVPWSPPTPDAAKKAIRRAHDVESLVDARGAQWAPALRDDVLAKLREVADVRG